ncbi:WYL domain-containing protein [Actinomyces viscosus]|uniref:Proteasome accessory factor C n=1 Tax=Actinomyces viscosus TaxID=1656 RepID=A0A3S4Z7L4_ACTVI|nr:WYL domain-containing protein [Actinomyces viscosus]TFH53943.1 WYL domain-containing protein [Actinomyces viscosus]VEI14912.1 Proteasome accessory factor C [Actinomyces viscosus]
MARVSASDQLTRLLALPAWVADHPGVSIKEAAEHFGVTPAVIERDVNTLWVSGLPGGLHGDLVDFDATDFEAGRLRLAEPLGLDRPVRLTRQEAISLLMALRVLADLLADDEASAAAIVSTQQALTDLLAAGASDDDVAAVPRGVLPVERSGHSTRTAQVLGTVRSALRDGRRLHLVYVSATDTSSERDVDPITLESDGSHMTLVAWCLSAKAERSFRLDRIESAQLLDIPAIRHRSRRRKAGSEIERSAGERPRATLTLRPTGRWLVEQIPCVSQEETADGNLRAVVEGRDRAWLVGLVLSAGRHLIAVEPTDLAQETAGVAERALTSYDTGAE